MPEALDPRSTTRPVPGVGPATGPRTRIPDPVHPALGWRCLRAAQRLQHAARATEPFSTQACMTRHQVHAAMRSR
jgi:hypothetical protein